MTPPQLIDTAPLPSTLDRKSVGVGPENDRRNARATALLHVSAPRVTSTPRARVERTARAKTPISDPEKGLLSAQEFERCLERERCLADRGTRRFSLLVLRRRTPAAPDESDSLDLSLGRLALADLARQACRRLRSTDLVGRPDEDCVEILLTDTEPAGARVLAAWVEQVETRLGLELERTIFVYPSVTEPVADTGKDGLPPDRSPHDGAGSDGHTSGRTTPRGTLAPHLHVAAVPTERSISENRWPMEDLWPLLAVPTPPWKRTLDVLLSSIALLFLLPLFTLIAIALRLDTPGPVIFKQMRAGRGGRPFAFYKFRSMVVDAEARRAALADRNEQDGPIFKIHDDPRITRVGRLLRRWSLDELPQLWNVLKGDISLVGPRSPTLDELCKYERWQRRRLSVTGGITCTWQVSGRSQIGFRDWMRLDMRYVACRNVWLDIRLLALTLPAVISGRGAC